MENKVILVSLIYSYFLFLFIHLFSFYFKLKYFSFIRFKKNKKMGNVAWQLAVIK